MRFSRKKWSAVLFVVLLLTGGSIWLLRHLTAAPPPPDPQVTALADGFKQLTPEATKDISEEELKERATKLFQDAQKMTPDQRKQMGQEFRSLIQSRVDKYYSLPTEEEKQAFIDAEIDRMEMFRKLGAFMGGPRRNRGADQGGQGNGESAKKDGDANRSGDAPGRTPPLDRDARRREMLDSSTPEQRAQFMAYFNSIRERRQQRGLPPMGGPR